MFETAILDDRGTKSRSWTMAAVGMQLAVVGSIVLIPLLAPSTMQLIVKQATITFQPTPLPPAPVPQQRTAASSVPTTQSALSVIRDAVQKVLVAPRRYDTPVQTIIDPGSVSFSQSGNNTGVPFVPGALQSVGGLDITQPPPPATPTAVKPVQTGPIVVGGRVLEAKMIKRVIPIYPALAKQARISGSVRLEGIIAKDGTIQHLRVLGGHPLLVPAAIDAVRQWVYSPTLLNGQAVEVIAPIDVNFVLRN